MASLPLLFVQGVRFVPPPASDCFSNVFYFEWALPPPLRGCGGHSVSRYTMDRGGRYASRRNRPMPVRCTKLTVRWRLRAR